MGDSQRILLQQLKQQSDSMAASMSNGQHFQLSNSPTMARQIANKLRMDKQLCDLKQQIITKRNELSLISQQLSEQCQRQNVLFSSLESNQSDILKQRISEIQKLYKLRERNLKQRIDSYKKELQKRDKELNNINSMLSSSKKSATKIKKEIIRELRSLQIERSKSLNRRDLKNQIKERDEQIAFLVNHFGTNQDEDGGGVDVGQSLDARLYSSSPSRSHALSQIDANLTSALAPFQDSLTPRKQNKISSAYHFVPPTSESSGNHQNDDSMLHAIFGNENPLQSNLYKRETFSSKQKKKKKKSSRYDDSNDDDDDD